MEERSCNMESLNCKTQTIKCPKCLNKMSILLQKNGDMKGTCQICKSTVITKQHSNETLIRIVNNN